MRKGILVIFTVVVTVALLSVGGSTQGLGLEFGANVSQGTLAISDHDNYYRYHTSLNVISMSGSLQLTPKLSVIADYTFGDKNLAESDIFYVSAYSYDRMGLTGAVALTENIDLTAGYTRFTSTYAYDGTYDGDVVRNTGRGFKVGLSGDVPLADNLSASVKYSFLPVVHAFTYDSHYSGPSFAAVYDGWSETYMGQGHELEANITYTMKSGISASAGLRSEKYAGNSDCCLEYLHDLASFQGLSLGFSYEF